MKLTEQARPLVRPLDVHPRDGMYVHDFHYRGVGESFWRCMNAALAVRSNSTIDAPISRVLDFGCGYGWVTRVMRQIFPNAEIVASDVTADKGEWCARHFGATEHVVKIDLDRIVLPGKFDLIWLGSVVTHLKEAYAARLSTIPRDHTAEHGLLMVSSMGRLFIPRLADAIHNDATDKIWGFNKRHALNVLSGVARSGYGFSPFTTITAFDERYSASEANYGTSLMKVEWWSRLADQLGDVRMHFLRALGTNFMMLWSFSERLSPKAGGAMFCHELEGSA